MSYYCSISFKKMEPADIIPFFQSFKKTCGDRLHDIAKDEYSYCPFIKFAASVPKDFAEITLDKRFEAVDWANNSLFKFKYFYDTEFKLLGVFGVTPAMKDLFDGTVDFQNSTDQDYKRKEWCGVSNFEEIFDKWANASDEEVKIAYGGEYGDSFEQDYAEDADDPELMKKHLDYVRRSRCYQEIWSRYEKYLWESYESIYFSVYGYYERSTVMEFIKYCHEEQVKWEEEFEREWNAKHGSLSAESSE